MNAERTVAPSCLLLFALLGLLAMFAASFQGLTHTHAPRTAALAATESAAGENAPTAEPNLALNEGQLDDLTVLMRKLQTDPNDADALMEIGELFLVAKEWMRAEAFLMRAVLARPADTRPRYLLGLAQYRQEHMEEAAATFEELLSIKEDQAALFNLAIIYKHHLKRPAEARTLLEKLASAPDSDADMRERAQKELDGLE